MTKTGRECIGGVCPDGRIAYAHSTQPQASVTAFVDAVATNLAESSRSPYPFSLLSPFPSYYPVRATPFASAKRELAKL